MKILFLDVDGPLIPLRIHVKSSEFGYGYDRYDDMSYVYDKNFIKELNEHCPPQNIQIVFNTSHNDNQGVTDVKYCAIKNGLNPNLIHPNYKTKFPSIIPNRLYAIRDWLMNNVPENQECKWIVVDDIPLKCGKHLENVDLKQGVTDKHIINIFGKFLHEKEIIYCRK